MRQLRAAAVALALGAPGLAHAEVWPTTIARVQQGVTNADPVIRREAATHLNTLPPSRVRQILPLAIKDTDPQVRVAAGRAALRAGVEAKAEAEVWLSDADPAVRQVAAQMLGAGVPSAGAVTALARTLSDPVPAVRLEAARALANASADDGARVLLNHLDDAQEAFVLAVVEALAKLRSDSAVVPLVGKVSDPRVTIRRAVVRALGEFEGVNQVTMPLVLALGDSDPEVRRLAIESIVAARALGAMPALEERVKRDRDVDVRAAALDGLLALAEVAPEGPTRARAAALAVECLSHERQELRSQALEALSERAHAARPQLRDCLTSSTGEVVGRCGLALAHEQDPSNAALLIAAWRQGRILAPDLLSALSVQQGDESLLMVLELLQSDAPGTRTRAIEVMGVLLAARDGDGRAVEPVVEALRRAKAPTDIEALLSVLGATGSVRAVPTLLPFLDAANTASLRLAAVRALGEIRGAKVPIAVVESLLTNEDVALRAATTIALREGEWQATTPLLLRLLSTAKLDEAESLAVALWGPVRQITDAAVVSQLERLIDNADPRLRAALIEALARVEWKWAAPAWQRLAKSKSCDTAAKVAEVLGVYPEAVALVTPLTANPCTAVVANAVWALGYHGDSQAVERVLPLIEHDERAVAGNAVATLARLATRTGRASEITAVLCGQVRHATMGAHPARAANALYGLRTIGQRCSDGSDERLLLATSTAPQVRVQAAWLLHAVPSSPDVDRKALDHCVRHDTDGQVASACLEPHAQLPQREPSSALLPTTIMVIPATRTKPEPAVPFSLLTESGATRFGSTDARGAVWMQVMDADAVSLSLPVGQW